MNKPKAKFLNKNGYDFERERAAKVFDLDKEYTIKSGEMYSSSSNITFEEVEGKWNTVMFDFDWGAVKWNDAYTPWNERGWNPN